jgi:serine/threonine protein phosphatase 1
MDRLICLGDVCDRGRQVKECIDALLNIPNCVYILGNHDVWTLEWMRHGSRSQEWLEQGGAQTIASYKETGVPPAHLQFLSQAPLWFVDNNRLFVHGGFEPELPLEETNKDVFLWDRHLIKKAQEMHHNNPEHKFGPYDEVFVGHTPTLIYGRVKPQKFCNVWEMDTGAGHGAQLTIMDVDTKQFWQSPAK